MNIKNKKRNVRRTLLKLGIASLTGIGAGGLFTNSLANHKIEQLLKEIEANPIKKIEVFEPSDNVFLANIYSRSLGLNRDSITFFSIETSKEEPMIMAKYNPDITIDNRREQHFKKVKDAHDKIIKKKLAKRAQYRKHEFLAELVKKCDLAKKEKDAALNSLKDVLKRMEIEKNNFDVDFTLCMGNLVKTIYDNLGLCVNLSIFNLIYPVLCFGAFIAVEVSQNGNCLALLGKKTTIKNLIKAEKEHFLKQEKWFWCESKINENINILMEKSEINIKRLEIDATVIARKMLKERIIEKERGSAVGSLREKINISDNDFESYELNYRGSGWQVIGGNGGDYQTYSENYNLYLEHKTSVTLPKIVPAKSRDFWHIIHKVE